jgi:hypothetical protein
MKGTDGIKEETKARRDRNGEGIVPVEFQRVFSTK